MLDSHAIWIFVSGATGLGFVLWGRQRTLHVPFFCGLALVALPFTGLSTTAWAVSGALLVLASWFVRV